MKFQEIRERLTGLSCPFFGASWDPPEAERTVARRVVTFLEDRRVLYVDSEIQAPRHPYYCVESVLEIRKMLTKEIAGLPDDSPIAQGLRALRAE